LSLLVNLRFSTAMGNASVPFTVNRRPRDDDDADVAEEIQNSAMPTKSKADNVSEEKDAKDQSKPINDDDADDAKKSAKEFFLERCSAYATLKSRNYPQSTPIKVYEYCTEAIEDDEELIPSDILFLIFEFSQTPVDLIVVAGGESRTVRRDVGGFTVPAETMVRADVCAPLENGSYYFELKLAEDVDFHAGDDVHVGWCDCRWQPQNFGMGLTRCALVGVELGSHDFILHDIDDMAGNSFSIMGRMSRWFHGLRSPGPMVPNDTHRLNGWRGGDVIGCGIRRYGNSNQFNVIFYLNGELIGEAWSGELCDGRRLYPACAIRGPHGQHQMVFGESKMQYLPDGFEPLYCET